MSSKFKMKLKLTGLELEIEGSREDIPMLMQNVGAQLAGQLAPAANIAAAKLTTVPARPAIDGQAFEKPERAAAARRPRKPGSTGNGSASGDSAPVLSWVHDPNVWGNPVQTWNGTDKGIWLLYVAKQLNVASEMTTTQIYATFDKLFRSAKAPDRTNLKRDFGKLAGKPPAKVSSNGTVDPPAWFLTDAGIRHAESLVKAARGEPDVAG